MCWYKIRLKNIVLWASWGVNLISRIVCQISGQDNVSCKIQKLYWHFQIKSFCFCVSIAEKVVVEIFVLTRVLFVTAILTIALLSENSTDSLKFETRCGRYLSMLFLDI